MRLSDSEIKIVELVMEIQPNLGLYEFVAESQIVNGTILDSFETMLLIDAIEAQYGVVVSIDALLVPANQTLEGLSALIDRTKHARL